MLIIFYSKQSCLLIPLIPNPPGQVQPGKARALAYVVSFALHCFEGCAPQSVQLQGKHLALLIADLRTHRGNNQMPDGQTFYR
eukprot:1158803-Pelagomonas_calceolata.AAC.7